MSRKDHEVKKLRREVEALRAQMRYQDLKKQARGEVPESTIDVVTESLPTFDDSYVVSDLRRSLMITVGVLMAILVLTLTQSHWARLASVIGGIT